MTITKSDINKLNYLKKITTIITVYYYNHILFEYCIFYLTTCNFNM
jgi:hypothetical protein